MKKQLIVLLTLSCLNGLYAMDAGPADNLSDEVYTFRPNFLRPDQITPQIAPLLQRWQALRHAMIFYFEEAVDLRRKIKIATKNLGNAQHKYRFADTDPYQRAACISRLGNLQVRYDKLHNFRQALEREAKALENEMIDLLVAQYYGARVLGLNGNNS